MLHHDDRNSSLMRFLPQIAQSDDNLIKGTVDNGLPFQSARPGHDVVLNVYNKQSCFHQFTPGR